MKLWFDVEEEYGTTERDSIRHEGQLWFDVEEEYGTTTGWSKNSAT